MRRGPVVMGGVLLGLLAGTAGGRGQSGAGMPPMGPPSQDHGAREPDPGVARLQEQAAKSRNDERQKRLVADTAKLYELAGELKDEVGKTNKDTLSVDVVKKAEEIEKLARSVKEKMRG